MIWLQLRLTYLDLSRVTPTGRCWEEAKCKYVEGCGNTWKGGPLRKAEIGKAESSPLIGLIEDWQV
jgi:hypothetical protein